jgi:hypothetical protein
MPAHVECQERSNRATTGFAIISLPRTGDNQFEGGLSNLVML